MVLCASIEGSESHGGTSLEELDSLFHDGHVHFMYISYHSYMQNSIHTNHLYSLSLSSNLLPPVLVDPGRLTVNLSSSGPTDEVTASSEPVQLACGVLTVTVHSSPPDHRLEQRSKKHGKSLIKI